MVALAIPVVLSELGWMVQGIVDTIMVGKLGPAAIGAVALGNATDAKTTMIATAGLPKAFILPASLHRL
jgi:Na+-driven multidrug efflux pump